MACLSRILTCKRLLATLREESGTFAGNMLGIASGCAVRTNAGLLHTGSAAISRTLATSLNQRQVILHFTAKMPVHRPFPRQNSWCSRDWSREEYPRLEKADPVLSG